MLSDPLLAHPESGVSKKFRLRFRVPYPVFVDLLEKTRDLGFEYQPVNCARTAGVPLQLKLLGVLRVLGRGTCFDGIEEVTFASEEVHRSFFHQFTKRFVERYDDEYVYQPETHEEIRKISSVYERMGIPGALGSTDCVHVKWDMCPAGLTNYCTGKEG